MSTGNDSQLGFAIETTYGTAVTPTKFVPWLTGGIAYKQDRIESGAIFAGENVLRDAMRNGGPIDPSGNIGTELYNVGLDLLLKCALGATANVGSEAPYTHTHTPTNALLSFTTEQGVSRQDAVKSQRFAGCQINGAQLACNQGEIATIGFDIVAQSMDRTATLATASYPSGILPFKYGHGSVSVGGNAVKVTKATVDIKNNLKTDRRFLGSYTRSKALPMDLREITGTLTVEYDSDTYLDLAASQASTAVVLTFDNGTDSFVVTMNTQFDWALPLPNKRDVVSVDVPFKALRSSSDAAALTIVTTNAAATP